MGNRSPDVLLTNQRFCFDCSHAADAQAYVGQWLCMHSLNFIFIVVCGIGMGVRVARQSSKAHGLCFFISAQAFRSFADLRGDLYCC